jgi:hypothetical protein
MIPLATSNFLFWGFNGMGASGALVICKLIKLKEQNVTTYNIKVYTILYIMLENDFKGLEEVVSIVEPLNVVFTITNLVNLEEVEFLLATL